MPLFGRKRARLDSLSTDERRKLMDALGAVLAGLGALWDRPAPAGSDLLLAQAPDEVAALEQAAHAVEVAGRHDPAEPVYPLMLGHYLMLLGSYAECATMLDAAASRLPDDPRVSYAAATIWHRLSLPAREEWDAERRELAAAVPLIGRMTDLAAAARERLGVSRVEAGKRACRHFERTLALGLHPDDEAAVLQSLHAARLALGRAG